MERVKPILDWASDPANSTVIRTLVVTIFLAPAGLLGIFLGWRWVRGKHIASLIDAIAKQNQALHATTRSPSLSRYCRHGGGCKSR